MKPNLEQYFKENYKEGVIDHSIRVSVTSGGLVQFYIHPTSHNGETLDFVVKDSQLTQMFVTEDTDA